MSFTEIRDALNMTDGNLSVQIKTDYNASQPAPFANKGRTVVTPQTDVGVKEDRNRLSVIPEGASIGDLVQGLNALGVTSRDLISILQAIKQAGGLQAELEIL
jgi:flagellar P-ring protein precursor FlgI